MIRFYLSVFAALIVVQQLFSQNISGKVINQSDGSSLRGVHVSVENTFLKTFTDAEGMFIIQNIKPGTYNINISAIGFENQSLQVNVSDNVNLDVKLVPKPYMVKTFEVTSLRAAERSPFTERTVTAEELEKINLGQDLPILLDQTPSVVVNSDAGAGIGYTGIRIRGTDITRINVTINGIPVNDAESQGVFFVNMPDFTSSVNSIQIQRGVGSSTNGAGAFGASININTNELRSKPYAEINNSVGSFNTFKHTLMAGTGLIDDKFTVDARLSRIRSDGFIDRAFSDLNSYYVSGAYHGKKTIIRANVFSGREQTYQAWYGVPEELLHTNRTFNIAGTERLGEPYENETDNYRQDHYQLFLTRELSSKISANVGLHYTRGLGYYEQYKANQRFSRYNMQNVVVGDSTITRTDLVRQLWLDNHFYGGIYSFHYNSSKLNVILGGGVHIYEGDHYGRVIWARFASDSEPNHPYYENRAIKNDANTYLKAEYSISRQTSIFADMQVRYVDYNINGFRNNPNLTTDIQYVFFNPKMGVSGTFDNKQFWYASFAVANKEPNRNDFEAGEIEQPTPESLYNLELGYSIPTKKARLDINGFVMYYQNQLILTGKVNDVGAYTRQNVDQSYRAGIEVSGAWNILNNLIFNANFTLSQNRIIEHDEFFDNFDDGTQGSITHKNTDIAFSPNIISGASILYKPFKNFESELYSKYVGRQFLDNTSNINRSLNPFFVQNLRLSYSLKEKISREINLSLLVNNLFNVKYEPNGYTFSYIADGKFITENFYYPQANINYLLGLSVKF